MQLHNQHPIFDKLCSQNSNNRLGKNILVYAPLIKHPINTIGQNIKNLLNLMCMYQFRPIQTECDIMELHIREHPYMTSDFRVGR